MGDGCCKSELKTCDDTNTSGANTLRCAFDRMIVPAAQVHGDTKHVHSVHFTDQHTAELSQHQPTQLQARACRKAGQAGSLSGVHVVAAALTLIPTFTVYTTLGETDHRICRTGVSALTAQSSLCMQWLSYAVCMCQAADLHSHCR